MLLTILGLIGIPVLFLPFTFSVSPFKAVSGHGYGDLWRLGLPFFLAILISFGFVRWRFFGKLTQTEGVIGYMAGLGSACVTFSLYFDAGGPPWARSFREAVAVGSPFIVTVLAIWRVWRNRRMGVPMAVCSLICLQAAYLANSVFCLVGFYGGWQIGAWLTLAVSMVYVVQVFLIPLCVTKPSQAEAQRITVR